MAVLDFSLIILHFDYTMQIIIYTDGACDIHAENQPGGWAAIICAMDEHGTVLKETVLSGGQEKTTNNQMELRAVIEGLKKLVQTASVTIVTDSRYVIDIATGKNRSKRNAELWREYEEVARLHNVKWRHVSAHSGDSYNERCDKLAVLERKKYALYERETTAKLPSLGDKTGIVAYLNNKSTTKKKNKRAAWAAILLVGQNTEVMGAALNAMTFYEAMLLGLIQILRKCPVGQAVIIYTVQENIARNLSDYIYYWMRNDWKYKTATDVDGKPLPVKYREHWQELFRLTKEREVTIENYKLLRENLYFKQAGDMAAMLLELSE